MLINRVDRYDIFAISIASTILGYIYGSQIKRGESSYSVKYLHLLTCTIGLVRFKLYGINAAPGAWFKGRDSRWHFHWANCIWMVG